MDFEDMTDAITRCPKCQTSFKVNPDHLSSARGAVRCGSCLTIFNAKEHLIATEKPAPAAPIIAEEEEDALISDDMDANDTQNNLADTGFDENIFVAKGASKSDINLFERRIVDSSNTDDNEAADESWALSLLNDESDEEEQKDKANEANKTEHNASAEDLLALMSEPEAEEDDTEHYASDYSSDEPSFKVIEEEIEHSDEYEDGNNIDAAQHHYEPFEQDESNLGFQNDFEPEPLELHVRRGGFNLDSNYLWFPLSLAAALIAAFQIGYYNIDTWGRQQNLRPHYETACDFIGCTLPTLQDLNKIRVENMVVINHPTRPGMLLVDATILNQAHFEQAFPTLKLSFTNLQNEVLSRFEFPPKLYVGGELTGRKLMPSKHPIHITLDIDDPGTEAVNYQISVVKP